MTQISPAVSLLKYPSATCTVDPCLTIDIDTSAPEPTEIVFTIEAKLQTDKNYVSKSDNITIFMPRICPSLCKSRWEKEEETFEFTIEESKMLELVQIDQKSEFSNCAFNELSEVGTQKIISQISFSKTVTLRLDQSQLKAGQTYETAL